MNETLDVQSIRKAFEEAGQGQVFRFWDELDAESRNSCWRRRRILISASFRHWWLSTSLDLPESGIELAGLEPAPYVALPDKGGDASLWESAWQTGAEAIRAGRLAAFCVAGGQGTRLGYDGPKGTYPVTPVSGKMLFQVFAEKIARNSERFSTTIHWFILTSEINNEATIAAFEANGFFGLPKESVHFIVQGLVPQWILRGR